MFVLKSFLGNNRISYDKKELKYYVYFISDRMGHIKIGYTSDIRLRMDAIQTDNALPLLLVAYFSCGTDEYTAKDLESKLHTRFQLHRLCGEWFKIKPVLRWLEYIPEDVVKLVEIRGGRILYEL